MAINLTKDHHLLTRNLKLNDYYISNDGHNEGISIDNGGDVAFSGKVGIGEDDPAGVLDVLNASITTTNLLDLSAVGLTTGSLIYGVGNSNPTNGGTSKLLELNLFSLSTLSHTSTGMELDYNKNVVTASGRTATISGLHVDIDDGATNNASGTVAITGIDVDVDFSNSTGTTSSVGLNVAVAGAATNYAALFTGGNVGIGVAIPTATLEVQNGSNSGEIAFKVDNNDVDQHAIKVEASNTTVNVIDIDATAVTTGDIFNISTLNTTTGSVFKAVTVNPVPDGATSHVIHLYNVNAGTGDQTARGIYLDFDKGAVTASSKTSDVTGIHLDLDDTVNNVGTANMTGLAIDVDFANAGDGTTASIGLNVDVAGADTNYAALFSGGNVGIGVADPDVALEVFSTSTQLKLSHNADDYATFTVADTGDLTVATLGDGTTDSDMTLDVDGDITLDAAGDNIKMLGSGGSGLDFIQSGTGDYTIKNLTSDKDIIFNVNDGGSDTEVFRLDGSTAKLSMYQSNSIEFGGASESINGDGNNLHIQAATGIDFGGTTCGFTAQTGTDAVSIDWRDSNKYHLLLENSSTVTFATNPNTACNLLLKVAQGDGGSNEITWAVTSGDIYWAGGGVTNGSGKPTLTTTDDDSDIISFYFDGTNYFGVASLNFDTAS
jgi:hypothetical protein